MARKIGILTALTVKSLSKPGLYGDGGGLYLQVGPTGAKSWIYRFMRSGHARTMGLGPLHTVSLAEARTAALQCRQMIRDGHDPIEQRNEQRRVKSGQDGMTFAACAEAYIKAHEAGWKNPKHVMQWRNTIMTYAEPVFGKKPVEQIDLGLVMRVLEPIWSEKTETASRLRGRIESILDWATVRG